ncbi:hypothetical protein BJF90_09155 [Pseudonocardia sp. CNS-004]|nr:hypothetical protein BJF90_09155 [Pseudonocardia sp. CNS-004]
MRHFTPWQVALTWAALRSPYPPDSDAQAPKAPQRERATPRTAPSAEPMARVFDQVRVTQPRFVPLSHTALTEAFVVANRRASSFFVFSVRPVCTDDVAVSSAWQPVPNLQCASPRAWLRLRRPSGPPTAPDDPVSFPTHRPSAQSIPTVADAEPPRAVPPRGRSSSAVSTYVAAVIPSWQPAVPTQRANPRASLRSRRASGPYSTSGAPLTHPLQPAGQSTWELLCPLPIDRRSPPLV